MLHKKNLMAMTVGTILLAVLSAPVFSAADSAATSDHQHSGGQSAAKNGNHHSHHQCEHKMAAVDANKDGKISKDEFMKHHETMFDKMDTNKDGFLDEKEMHHMMDHMHQYDQQKSKSSNHAH